MTPRRRPALAAAADDVARGPAGDTLAAGGELAADETADGRFKARGGCRVAAAREEVGTDHEASLTPFPALDKGEMLPNAKDLESLVFCA